MLYHYLIIPMNIELESCIDELPEDWIPTASYQPDVMCSVLDCKALARDNLCNMDFSDVPLSNCVNDNTGLVKKFCKYSCNNCIKQLKNDTESTTEPPIITKTTMKTTKLKGKLMSFECFNLLQN